MSIPDVEVFSGDLRRSNLLSPDQWSEFERWRERPEGVAEPRQLLHELVARGWLTAWQAGMLLAGRDAFFLGRYKLLDQLGEGGMGTVFKAEQTPLGRIVALKVMSPALLKDPSAVARFHREIQAAAALAHPNVVAALDAESVRDTHFLVMEYVAGRDLNKYAAGNRALPVGWSCECIRQAALGLQHAHERGMVHRDIKPANLLVASSPLSKGGPEGVALQSPDSSAAHSVPTVKILDLGLARFVSESAEDGGLTGVGQVLGTPDYISPEQARDTHAADIRSDIYSLGCTLFRLLTGRVPFDGNTVVEKLLARTARDAPRLSSLRPDVPPALEAVVAQMLARDPARRYQTPLEVARALTPFCRTLDALPDAPSGAITAALPHPEAEFTSVFEPTNPTVDKFLRTLSHTPVEEPSASDTRSNAAGAARLETSALPGLPLRSSPSGPRAKPKRTVTRRVASLVTAVAAILAIGWGAWLAFTPGALLLDWQPAERDGGELMVDGREVPLPRDGPIRLSLPAGRHRLKLVRRGYEPVELAEEVQRGVQTPLTIDWTPRPGTRRRQEWRALERELPPAGETTGTARPPAGPFAAKLHDFRRRWPGTNENLEAARALSRLEWPLDKLAAAEIPENQRFDWHPPELVAVFGETGAGHPERVQAVVYRPDGLQVASCGGDGLIRLWDPATMKQQAAIERNTAALAYTPDSRYLIAGGPGAAFFDVSGKEPVEKFTLSDFEGPVGGAVVSPDGRTLVLIDTRIRLFDLADLPPQERASLPTDRWSTGATFTPDSQTLITWSAAKTIKLWNLASGKSPELRARLEAHGEPRDGDYVCGVVVSADGKRMVSSGVWDWSLLSWDLQPAVPEDPVGFHHSTALTVITRSPDGKYYAVGCWDGTISLFDLTADAPPPMVSLRGHAGQVWGAAFSPDSRHLVTGGNDGALHLWNIDGAASDKHEFPRTGHGGLVSGISFTPDGRQLFSTGHDGRTIVWDVATRRPLHEFPRIAGPILASALSPDGRLLAVGDLENAALRLVDAGSGETRHAMHGIPWPAMFRFSPDGRRIAAPVGNTVRSWDVTEGEELPAVGEYLRPVAALAFFADGKSLVAGNNTAPFTPPATGDVLQWEISTGKERERFRGDKAAYGVYAIDCSPDGKTFAVALQPGGLIVWDASGRAPRATNVAGPAIGALAFSLDGRHLATLDSGNSVVTLRHPETGAEVKSWRLASQPQSLAFSPDCRHLALGNVNGTICVLRLD